MPELTIHTSQGSVKRKSVSKGINLAQALGEEDLHLDTPCGGAGRCGKCTVRVRGSLSAPAAQEQALLGSLLEEGFRLACQAHIEGDAEIWPGTRRGDSKIEAEGALPAFNPDPMFQRFGAAIDIGTTTLAARLYDREGTLLAQASSLNPQHRFGADVISRIEKSLAGEREALARCICQGLDQLLDTMAAQAGIRSDEIDTVVLTGNSTMLYLLTSRDPDCLSHAPFEADERFGRFTNLGEVTLSSVRHAQIYLPHCISAFVGADTTCALLASGICDREDSALLADIGTNGELALWHHGSLLCCSTAAGPVFEGAGISQGMQGSTGAIDRVAWQEGALKVHTIGEAEPRGICGSGIIDAASALLQGGLLDESGALEATDNQILLAPGVSLTQKDIRMVQLAKAAICAGIRTILDQAGLDAADLDLLAVSGGFGSYLDLSSAANIGLLPPQLAQKADILGNAALTGASMLLLNRAFIGKAGQLAALARVTDLSTSPIFAEYYIDCMSF